MVHCLLADTAAHLAQQRGGAGAVGCAAKHVLVRVKVCRCIKVVEMLRVIDEQSVRVAGAQAD
jgi:hypothetical protein